MVDETGKIRIRTKHPLVVDGQSLSIDVNSLLEAKSPLSINDGKIELKKSSRLFTRPPASPSAATNAAAIDDILLALAELGFIELS